VAFQIPPNIFGPVNVAGSAGLYTYLQNVAQQFSTLYSNVTVNLDLTGEPAGLRRLCNNEIDIVVTSYAPSADALSNCEANNISTTTVEVGRQAAVILANANDDYLECLTVNQVIDIWGNTAKGTATNWNEISGDFPEAEILLVSPTTDDSYTDLLLTPENGPVVPARLDAAESNSDPLYRAAAVGNVNGSMTYMSWRDYQTVQGNAPGNIQLVSINAGTGCITPSEDSILSGEYPYTEAYSLVINQSTLTAPEKQSFLWYLFSDENYAQFERGMLIGPRYGKLPDIRDELQNLFDEASTLPPPMPETTPEVTPEATPEATPAN
jgi:phosphate transport system substrate-binding protein